ncbi:LuxR C-terminal-related transcriptional regulator [Cellulomonas sp. HZM]|uniref:helix-turn-helix domain-containing protein n=1 Tax=Cellulomonas sp. HZM TaxID=1454010 RepID=UPI00068E2974|nr:LuxR C-terminal-related transcriptional regulator [Cellulomonas sp. HZM]
MTIPPWLSSRELVILSHLALPLTLEQIGASLFVSRNTVKTQVRSIYAKLGVSDRASAVRRAHDLGLLPVSELPARDAPEVPLPHAPWTGARRPPRYLS